MNHLNINDLRDKFQKNGIIALENFIKETEIDLLKNIVKFHCGTKNISGNTFPANLTEILKIIKKPKKIFNTLKLFYICKKYNLKKIANKLKETEMELVMIDGYISEKSNIPVLDWHVDQAYSGKKNVSEFVDPDKSIVKFFFYLTDVDYQNGCLGYIPGSNKIAYFLKKLIKNKKIKYNPYWSLKDLRNQVTKEEIYNNLKKEIEEGLIKDFVESTDFLENKNSDQKYFFPLKKGSLLIFDEAGAHKGSSPKLNDRYVLRFFFRKK